jgi:hypothetical protein
MSAFRRGRARKGKTMNTHLASRILAIGTLALTLILAQSSAAFAHYPPGAPALGGRGTAVIDGTFAAGEWASAGTLDLVIELGSAGTAPGRFYVMNDDRNLYVALRVDARGVSPAVQFTSLVMEFDNDHDGGIRAEGDDVFVANPPSWFVDDYRTYLPPCPSGALCGLRDVDTGGTDDGQLAFSHTSTEVIYEVSKALDSADDAHDFSLRPGDVVGFWLMLRVFSPDFADTTYPFFVFEPSRMGDIHIMSSDATPPLIAWTITPTPNALGWTNAPTTVSWSVADAESGIATTSGCTTETTSSDTAARTLTCSATNNAGLGATGTATVRVDRTPPSIVLAGNAGTYAIDESVDISCSAADALSGLATPADCGGMHAAASAIGPGTTVVTRSASDNAGNTATASTSVTVTVTSDGLCRLTRAVVLNAGLATALCQQLEHGAADGYRHTLAAQSGRAVSPADADLLASLSLRL